MFPNAWYHPTYSIFDMTIFIYCIYMHLCICFIASTYNIYQHIICIQDIFNILARSCYYFGQYWILNIDTGLIRLIRASKGWRLGKYQTWSPSCRIYIFVFFYIWLFDIFYCILIFEGHENIKNISPKWGILKCPVWTCFKNNPSLNCVWGLWSPQCGLPARPSVNYLLDCFWSEWSRAPCGTLYMSQDAPEVMWVTEWVTPLCLILLMWQTRQGPHLTLQVGWGTWQYANLQKSSCNGTALQNFICY